MKSLLIFQNVRKQYAKEQTDWELGPLSFEISQGEQVALKGPSGSGKSTLLHLAGALDDVSAGEICFQGASLQDYNEQEKARYRNEHIGFVFQHFYLFSEFTVLENVMMPLQIAGKMGAKVEQKAREMLSAVGLSEKERVFPEQLSGGQQQRVAIARALVNTPQLLLADEPTGNLDEETAQEILELLQRLHTDFAMTFLIATHDEAIAEQMERILILRNGKIESALRNNK